LLAKFSAAHQFLVRMHNNDAWEQVRVGRESLSLAVTSSFYLPAKKVAFTYHNCILCVVEYCIS
jgi:hypothetical protein